MTWWSIRCIRSGCLWAGRLPAGPAFNSPYRLRLLSRLTAVKRLVHLLACKSRREGVPVDRPDRQVGRVWPPPKDRHRRSSSKREFAKSGINLLTMYTRILYDCCVRLEKTEKGRRLCGY